jgi:hypothetical protein
LEAVEFGDQPILERRGFIGVQNGLCRACHRSAASSTLLGGWVGGESMPIRLPRSRLGRLIAPGLGAASRSVAACGEIKLGGRDGR